MKRCLVFTWNIVAVNILFTVTDCTGTLQLEGGPCYSQSQVMCSKQWTDLWVAKQERKTSQLCRLFTELHKCTTQFSEDYQSTCPLQQHEKDLYQRDIVDTYTKPPYRCPLIGGNIKMPPQQYGGNTGSTFSSHSTSFWTCMFIQLLIIKHLLQ